MRNVVNHGHFFGATDWIAGLRQITKDADACVLVSAAIATSQGRRRVYASGCLMMLINHTIKPSSSANLNGQIRVVEVSANLRVKYRARQIYSH